MKTIAKASIIYMGIAVGSFVLLAPLDILAEVINIVGRILIATFIVALGFYLAGKS